MSKVALFKYHTPTLPIMLTLKSCKIQSLGFIRFARGLEFWPLSHVLALILCLLVSSAVNICKQFGPRSGPTIFRA